MNFFLKNIKINLASIFIIFLGYSLISINVTKRLSSNDIEAIKMLKVDDDCKNPNDFESQINCIKSIQLSQSKLVKSQKCRTGFLNVEPLDFVNTNFGCCFDRSRIIEKSLEYYKIETRKIFLIDISKGYLSLFKPEADTHAVVEAKTEHGWIGIETVQPLFILLDEFNKPLSFKNALKAKYNFPKSTYDDFYYRDKIMSIIGLYSRNGMFHKPYFPFFEINIIDFFSNLLV